MGSGDALFDGQMAENFDDLTATMFASLPSATGVSLDELMPRVGGQASTGPASSLAAASAFVSGDAAQVDDEDDRLARPTFSSWGDVAQTPSMATHSDHGTGAAFGQCGAGGAGAAPNPTPEKKRPLAAGGSAGAGGSAAACGGSAGGRMADSDSKRRRGRPARPVSEVARETLNEYEACDPDSKYFGPQPNFRRAMERTFAQLSTEAGASDEPALVILKKQFQAALEVCKRWARQGAYDNEMARQFSSSKHFLQMCPSAPCCFPRWLSQQAHTHEIEAPRMPPSESIRVGQLLASTHA